MCAFVKISDLPVIAPATPTYPLTAGDVMPIVHGNTTYKVELSTLKGYLTQNQILSAAGPNFEVQYSYNGNLCADPGFVYSQSTSSLNIGYNNVLNSPTPAGNLGGQNNLNNNNNSFIIGSNMTSIADNYTYVNNISSQGLVTAAAGNSVNWYSAYAYTNAQSGRLSQPSLDSRYLVLTGGTLSGSLYVLGNLSAFNLSANNIVAQTLSSFGNVNIGGNLIVDGSQFIDGSLTVVNNLSVLGTLAYLDTTVSVTSSLSVINFGSSPGLTIQQYGNTPIAVFEDPTGGGFVEITSTGQVGINTSTPNNALAVIGSVSASGSVYGTQAGINTSNPNKTLTVVGDISATGTIYGALSGGLTPVQNVYYVSSAGNDSNSGRTIFSPLATIKKACQLVSQNQGITFPVTNTIGVPTNQYTIFVDSGTYVEQNPVFVPPYTSIIGDNLRRVSILPSNPTYDILWCHTGVYVWGVTFRNHLYPSAACAFPNVNSTLLQYNTAFNYPGYEIANVPSGPGLAYDYFRYYKPFIIVSPYIQGCSSYTSSSATNMGTLTGGCGIRVDGSLVRGYFRSFVTDSFTQVNQSGYGIHITNNGYASLVSTFTICCGIGVYADKGGTCSINTSNCTFGLSGLVADGYSTTPVLTGYVSNNIGYNTNNISVSGLFPRNDPPDYLAENVPINAPYQGLCYRLSNDTSNTLYYVASAIQTDPNKFIYNILNLNATTTNIASGGIASFYITSQITTGSHTFEYVGTTTNLATSVPAIGGVTSVANPNNEAIGINGGNVFFTSTNQLGNFKVGNGFTILQATGTIQGQTFQRAILALVTPLSLALE